MVPHLEYNVNDIELHGERMLGYDRTPRVTTVNFLCQTVGQTLVTANAVVTAAKEYFLPFDLI